MATATVLQHSTHTQASPSPITGKRVFSGLDESTVSALAKASSSLGFADGDIVYSEGDPAAGMYVVLSGKVKLSVSSPDGKSLILRILLPGEVFSLSSVFLNRPQETSAEALERSTVSFVKRADLLRLMDQHGDLALRLARELSLEYASLCEEMSTLGLQRSAMSRLAKLIIGWTEGIEIGNGPVQIDCEHTHEVMAQMIGTSRETVTRLLHQLRHQKVATIKDEILTISNFPALQALSV
jgi:CRP/FNR family transcriptional regulator, cyclic AMP receptor protein